MTISNQILTFGSTPVQVSLTGLSRTCARLYVEPLRTNVHAAFVGASTVTNDGSGAGVVKELAAVGSSGILDSFNVSDAKGRNRIDPLQWYFHGTSGETAKVTLFFD